MKKLTSTICLAVALLLGSAGVAWSQDYQKGLTAAQSGDYATALREWTPLAKQGNADAQSKAGVTQDNVWCTPYNENEAVKGFQLALEQGNAVDQCSPSSMNANGIGVSGGINCDS
jgi:uncharacterized protein